MDNINNSFDPLKEEYDIDELYAKGHPVKGKYAKHFKKVAIFLDDDLVDQFPDSEAVNRALRSLASH
ncbi:MAG: hypothetical protein IEMM0008_0632 [bacterium]|nr:MAG: hypothetical protein IEMM0008_0632 [bacterium]